jgi:shikimate kinase
MNHIAIIGFRGSGKTRVGKRLSKDLGLPFVDVDREIVHRLNLSSKEIYERFGEPFYRAMETTIIKELLEDKAKKVVSLGAGAPMQEQNHKYLKELGTVVYLKGSYETLKQRLVDTNSPLANEESGEEKIKKLLKLRDPVYRKFADVEVVTGVKPFDDLIEEIKEKLEAHEKNS